MHYILSICFDAVRYVFRFEVPDLNIGKENLKSSAGVEFNCSNVSFVAGQINIEGTRSPMLHMCLAHMQDFIFTTQKSIPTNL